MRPLAYYVSIALHSTRCASPQRKRLKEAAVATTPTLVKWTPTLTSFYHNCDRQTSRSKGQCHLKNTQKWNNRIISSDQTDTQHGSPDCCHLLHSIIQLKFSLWRMNELFEVPRICSSQVAATKVMTMRVAGCATDTPAYYYHCRLYHCHHPKEN